MGVTIRFLISSFFCSIKTSGMPEGESWADKRRSHSSDMKMRASLPLRKPVRLICMRLGSGFCKSTIVTQDESGEQLQDRHRKREVEKTRELRKWRAKDR